MLSRFDKYGGCIDATINQSQNETMTEEITFDS